jgi:uncharacterized membrane protein (UPF0182 family)
MFTVLGIIWIVVFAFPLFRTFRTADQLSEETRRRRYVRGTVTLAVGIALLVLLNIFQQIFTEHLWFLNLDFAGRFWLEIWAKVGLFVLGAVITFVLLFISLRGTAKQVSATWEIGPRKPEYLSIGAGILFAIIMGSWLAGLWEEALLFLNQSPTGQTDPIFGQSISFYLFSMPFLSEFVSWALFLFVLTLGGIVLSAAVRIAQLQGGSAMSMLGYTGIRRRLLWAGAALFVGFAASAALSLFELLYSRGGVVAGANWVDVNVRTAGYFISIALHLVIAGFLIVGGFKQGAVTKLLALEEGGDEDQSPLVPTKKTWIAPVAVIAGLILVNGIAPSVLSSVYVNPNEITVEEPYIRHNIEYTQRAYGLSSNRVNSRSIPVSGTVTPAAADANAKTLDNVRLWDPNALMANLKQQQAIRLYYEFHDVDVDRYQIDGEYRQMMLSVREMDKSQLPEQAQTWVSRKLKYTHGYGLVMLPVHEFAGEGRPDLYVRNIPPEVTQGDLQVTRPEIYYGERTEDYVYVKTTEQEFDYPAGDANEFTTYEGQGGVNIGNFFRRFMYSWHFDDYRQLFSGYFTDESRVMFRRDIVARAKRLAPFLTFDRDPYPVLTQDGRIKYILDAYTTSSTYPYSEVYNGAMPQFRGKNYVRNSVKAVVDAYDGSVDFYIADSDDPIVQTYDNVFPNLFEPMSQMPENLQNHVRYPQDYLTLQAELYRTYHMDNVQAFYQREDAWEFATERYRDSFQSVEPYYAMVSFPESDRLEFVLLLPFTPKNKNVLNAWIAGRSDPPHYGEIQAYEFPKGVEVLGPRQIEARVDQNAEMSRSLSLWNQQGSEVVRGNLLTIPLFNEDQVHIMFAEPIFLQAEDAQLPEIRRIVLADQSRVVWSDTFQESLELLVGEREREEESAAVRATTGAAPAQTGAAGVPAGQVQQAQQLFQEYQNLLSQGEYGQAGNRLEELRSLLQSIGATGNGGGQE